MAINPRAILSIFTSGGLSLRSVHQEAAHLQQQTDRIRELQQQALGEARKYPTGADGRITLLDYYRAATAAGVPLQQMFDLSNMDLRDIDIRAADIKEINEGLKQADGNARPIEEMMRFDGSKFYDVVFRPSTTFNDLGIGDRDTVSIAGGTFVGMGRGDTLTLGTGKYTNIRFENISGGTLELGRGTQVHVVTGQGASIRLVMGPQSVLSGFTSQPQPEDGTPPSGLSIIDIQAAPSARIAEAKFTGATLSPGSSVREVFFENVAFTDVNLAGVDFSGATFRGVTFNGQPATFQSLRDRGVGEDQLPASIDGTRRAAVEPPSIPQQIAMAAARQLVASGASVDGEKGIERPYVPQTAEARAAIAGRNEAFAESMIALASRDTGNA